MEFRSQALATREASRQLATLTRDKKDRALHAMADAVAAVGKKPLAASAIDVDAARRSGIPEAVIDRLRLDDDRVRGMVGGLRDVAALPDPVGGLVRGWWLGNGVEMRQVRVPFGVMGIIYESRPNVAADVAGLYLKSGNAALLRGSSSAIKPNQVCVEALRERLRNAGVSTDTVALVEGGHEVTGEMMAARDLVDVLIPRGRAGLINAMVERAEVPVIGTGTGNYHLYVDASADIGKAAAVLLNTKTRRPSVCNTVETLLIHRGITGAFLPIAFDVLRDAGVTVHGTPDVVAFANDMVPAGEDEFDAKYLSPDLAVRVVIDISEVITRIRRHTTGHSETIITESRVAADRFVTEIDTTTVLVNASNKSVDGGQFRLGAEIRIPTQKLHARGPMGLAELTSTKYTVSSDGQMRI